ncbi:magnesium transporter NIPA-domain-containing protein [Lipomyces oligophaga]|uniref:magnesium transporter NIPA-domain-containing protein n=1 Tax=Lipomyces oligophaga TaxID=45792 RepID=UPI0034CF9EB7
MEGASSQTVALGIVTGIVSNAASSVGLTLQRKSHMLEDEKPLGHVQRPPYKRKRWLFGMALFLVSNIIGSAFQITALPIVILAPLQASSLVFNSICATVFLSEPFTRYSALGTLLISSGAILIAAFGAIAEPNHTLEELLYLLGRGPFLLWFCLTMFVAVLILLTLRMMRTWRRGHTHKGKIARGIMFGVVSGILSAHNLLLAKSAVELVVRSIIQHDNQFNRWETWIICLGVIVIALTQLYILHQGLKLCTTSILYPLIFCIYNIVSIVDGLIYYDQASNLSPMQIGLVFLGTILLLIGVACLSWRLTPDPVTVQLAKSGLEITDAFISDSEAQEIDPLMGDSPSSDGEDDLNPVNTSRLLRANTGSSLASNVAPPPWTSRKLGAQERTEIWNELGDYDADELDLDSSSYLISVAGLENQDDGEDESFSEESVSESSTSSSSQVSRGPLGRLQNMILSRLS